MPADLMTLCLFHPLNGVPLMAASTVAFALKTGDFSDAAFMKKLPNAANGSNRQARRWRLTGSFHIPNRHIEKAAACLRQVRPMWQGRGGETCRPRYVIELHAMTSGTFKITKEEPGETLNNFNFMGRGDDLAVADRRYGTLNGITRRLNCGADYIPCPRERFRRLR
jgi:hypothetical protein